MEKELGEGQETYVQHALYAHEILQKLDIYFLKKLIPNEVTCCVTEVEDFDVCLLRGTLQFQEK